MPQTSFALITNLGRANEAAAFANSTTVEITHIAMATALLSRAVVKLCSIIGLH